MSAAVGARPGGPAIDRAGRWVDRLLRLQTGLVFLFLYLPILLVVLFSFNAGERAGELRGVSSRWYGAVLENTFVMDALQHSLVVAFVSAIIATTFGTMAALGYQRSPRWLRVTLDVLTYVAIIIPGIVIGIATLIFFVNAFGWVNPWLTYFSSLAGIAKPIQAGTGLPTIIAAHVVFTMAIVFVLVRARLAGMDRNLVDASMDLYATPWRTLRQITLPQLMPAILAGALLAFTFSFDDYIVASFTQGPGQGTLPLYVFGSIRRSLTPEINAIGTMILAVTLTGLAIVYLIFRRQARQSAAIAAAAMRVEADLDQETVPQGGRP